MKAEYRIKNVGGKFYPQVRLWSGLFFGWSKWKRIGEHTDGFGLYDYDGHPKDVYDCEKIIQKYHNEYKHTTVAKLFPNE